MKRWTSLLVLALLLVAAACDEQADKPVQQTPHRPDLEPADAQGSEPDSRSVLPWARSH